MKKAVFIQSKNGDPFHNLAAEEYILEGLAELSPVLFMWQSDNAVIIGRHQNPWAETDAAFMTRERIGLKLPHRAPVLPD